MQTIWEEDINRLESKPMFSSDSINSIEEDPNEEKTNSIEELVEVIDPSSIYALVGGKIKVDEMVSILRELIVMEKLEKHKEVVIDIIVNQFKGSFNDSSHVIKNDFQLLKINDDEFSSLETSIKKAFIQSKIFKG